MRGLILWPAYVRCRPGEGLRIERETHIDVKTTASRSSARNTPTGVRANEERQAADGDLPEASTLGARPNPLARADSPLLFHSKTGKPLLYGAMLTYWAKFVTKARLDDDPRDPRGLDPYHLRHFCESHLADLGRTAQDFAIQLGHTDGGARELYIHSYEDRAPDRLEAAYDMNVQPVRGLRRTRRRPVNDGYGWTRGGTHAPTKSIYVRSFPTSCTCLPDEQKRP